MSQLKEAQKQSCLADIQTIPTLHNTITTIGKELKCVYKPLSSMINGWYITNEMIQHIIINNNEVFIHFCK